MSLLPYVSGFDRKSKGIIMKIKKVNKTFDKRDIVTEVITMRLYQRTWEEIREHLQPKEFIIINDKAQEWIDSIVDIIELTLIYNSDIIRYRDMFVINTGLTRSV